MTYTKQTWTDGAGGGTPLSAARLGHIETGIYDVDQALAALLAAFHPIRTTEAYITAGDLVLSSSASWAICTTTGSTRLQGQIAAAAGDRIQISPCFLRTGSGVFLDIATIVSGAIDVYMGSKTTTPLTEGNPAYYPQAGSFPPVPGVLQHTVTSGQISGGLVTFALVYKGTSPETIYASSTYPFRMLLTNLGPEPS